MADARLPPGGDEPGRMEIEWDATEDYTFPEGDGSIVHDGLVATVLDTVMGGGLRDGP